MSLTIPLPDRSKSVIGFIFSVVGSLIIYDYIKFKYISGFEEAKILIYGFIILYIGYDLTHSGGFLR